MTPPRHSDDIAAEPPCGVDAYDTLIAEMAEVQGLINAAEARVVSLTVQALELGVSGGDNLSPQHWLESRLGTSPGRAADIVKLASRAAELPSTMAALAAGELSVDQAAVVARYVAPEFEASASRVSPFLTVRQLRKDLRPYRDKPNDDGPTEPEHGSVASGYDEEGYWLRVRLPEAQGAVVDQALKAMTEDLKRQAREAAAAAGVEPEPVYAADAFVALAEVALLTGAAARPGTDRYLVHVHLQAGPHGLELATHLGIPLPDGQRRRILCDAKLRGTLHDTNGAPLSVGRTTRTINRRLRRAIEHRDGGTCRAPGCGRTTGLEIHHIVHWEDGGPTDTANLITLCAHHHTCHHQGTLGIEGNADLAPHTAPGVVFTNTWGRQLTPTTPPVPPAAGSLRDAAAAAGLTPTDYQPPTGERYDRRWFHLQSDHPEPADTAPCDTTFTEPEPSPQVTGRLPQARSTDRTDPAAGTPADPTRAGPTA